MKTKKILLVLFLIQSIGLFAQKNKQILFLSSYNSRFPTYFQQINGVKEVLNSPGQEIDIEFLDSKRFKDSTSYRLFYKNLEYKLKTVGQYDVIIAADDNALDFCLNYHEALFSNVPIVFLGVNDLEKANRQNRNPRVTGIAETISIKATLDLMQNLFGEKKTFYAISDNTTTGSATREQFLKLNKEFPEIDFKLINFGDYDGVKAFQAKLKTIPERTPILLLSALLDANLEPYSFHNSLQIIYQSTKSPIFHLWKHGIGYGTFGGKFISLFDQGKVAGKIVADILNGEDISEMQVLSTETNRYFFNFKELQKYDIDAKDLPEKAVIVNKPVSFFSENKAIIIPYAILTGALIIFIIFLLTNIKKREKVEKRLLSQHKTISQLNQEISKSLKEVEVERNNFRSMFLNHNVVKLIINPKNGSIFDANKAAANFYGWTREELKSMNIQEINALNDQEIQQNINLIMASQEKGFDLSHKKADGSVCNVEVISSKIDIENQGFIYSSIYDITESKKHQFDSKLFGLVVEQSPIFITITNIKGIIEYVNPAFLEITGYDYQEVLGMNPRILKSGKHDKSFYKEIWNTILAGQTWSGELINKKKNGDLYTVSVAICPIINDDDSVDKFLAIGEDVTDRRKVINELVISKEKLEHSNRLKNEFIQNMSHEIRTPMNGIMGFANLLENRNLTDAKRKKYTQIIQKSGNQLLKIVNDILEITKLDTKQVTLHIEKFCLNELFIELHSIFSKKSSEQALEFNLIVDDINDEFIVETDRTKLYSILVNLLSNAFKFTSEGHVTFGYRLKENEIECFVEDSGIGIAEENLETIFNRFEQEEKEMTLQYDGLGLGLPISRENAKLLHGNISVVSKKNVGSTFYLTLPNSNMELPIVKNEIINKEISEKKKKFKILLAEDEIVNYWFIETILSDYFEFELLYAINGEIAVDLFAENPDVDIILMDLRMPEMDGFEATKIIKSKNPNVPIIAVTAFTTSNEKDMAFQNGCDDLITKPFNEDKLVELIKKYLS